MLDNLIIDAGDPNRSYKMSITIQFLANRFILIFQTEFQ